MSAISLLKTCGVVIATAIVLSGCLGDSEEGGDMVLMGYYEATVSREGEPVPTMASGADRQLKVLQDAGIQASVYKCATISPGGGPEGSIYPTVNQDVVLYLVPAGQVTAAEKLSMIVTKQGPGEALDPARTTYYDCHNPG